MTVDVIVYEKNDTKARLAGLSGGELREIEFCDFAKAAEGNVYLGKLTRKVDLANGKIGFFVNIDDSREAFINCEERGLDDLRACEGQSLIVQVAQEQRAEKGARLVRGIQIAGINLVYCPFRMSVEASVKINDKLKADEYVALVKENMIGQEGWILRTSAVNASKDDILREMGELRAKFDNIHVKARSVNAPSLLLAKTSPLDEYIIRNQSSLVKVIVNNRLDADKVETLVDEKVEVAVETNPFKENGLDEEIFQALSKEVRLKSGGRVIIEETKACVAIDVDSGEDNGNGGISSLNMEAAAEIVKQIRLRNLAGKIVIDFAGVSEYRFLKNVIDYLESELANDYIRTRVYGLSHGGLVEIIRMRRRPSLQDVMSEECPTCHGTGRVEK